MNREFDIDFESENRMTSDSKWVAKLIDFGIECMYLISESRCYQIINTERMNEMING